jgi:hypothetical protein
VLTFDEKLPSSLVNSLTPFIFYFDSLRQEWLFKRKFKTKDIATHETNKWFDQKKPRVSLDIIKIIY